MRLKNIKWFAVVGLVLLVATSVSAQQQRRRRTNPANNNTQPVNNYGTPDSTKQQPAQQTTQPPLNNYGTPTTPTANGAAATQSANNQNLPITVIKGGNGLLDTVKPSLRNDAAIELNLIKERTPLDYTNIREDDAVYRVRVWREIDIREKINLPFRYAADEDNGGQRFISILLGAIKSGQVTAFSADDDRFTTPITPDQAFAAFGAGNDTVPVFDQDQNKVGLQVRPKQMEPDSIYKFRLKEEWIFDKETSKLYVRILGIAPVIPYKLSTGDIMVGSDRPVWWVYYPDMRPVLAKYDVYNPKNFGAHMTWEELFEERMFGSYIIKSTLDNPYDITLAQKYPNSTLFRLLEGDKIKNQIFDYEQGLWSY